MTSRGRKSGDPLDRYDTDAKVVRTFLKQWAPEAYAHRRRPRMVWEPAAGTGNMVAPLGEAFPKATVRSTDIEPRAQGISVVDFLDSQAESYELIFTNPPFRLAEQFVRHAIELVEPRGYVVMFLRAGFLESKARWNFFEQFMPVQVWFLRSRPKFTGPNTDGESTDMALYAWFVWQKGKNPEHFEGRFI